MENDVRQSFETLKARVEAVAQKRKRVQTADGASRAALAVLVPLLATLGLDRWLGLHYLLRAGVVVAVAAITVLLLVKRCVLPLLKRYTLTESAMLVELGLPGLNGRVVSLLEVYGDLESDQPRFDRGMVRALIACAHDSTRGQNFGRVIDVRGLRRHSALAAAFAAIAIAVAVLQPDAFGTLFSRLIGSFSEVSQFARKIAGASIEVKPGDATILRGQNVSLTARQLGFHSVEMLVHVRHEGEPDESVEKLTVSADGKTEKWLAGQEANFVYYFSAEKVRSRQYTIKVTDRPRIANIRIEYEFPACVRRARKIFPELTFERIDHTDPVLGHIFKMKYSWPQVNEAGLPEPQRPTFWEAIFIDGRIAVLYTTQDLGCQWEISSPPTPSNPLGGAMHNQDRIPGQRETAYALGINIMLYILTH